MECQASILALTFGTAGTAGLSAVCLGGRPRGLKEVEISRIFRQSAHEGGKVVCPTHRPTLPPGKIHGTHFCQRLSRPQGHSAVGRIEPMKNVKELIGSRTSGLPACSCTAYSAVLVHTLILYILNCAQKFVYYVWILSCEFKVTSL